MGKSKKNRGDEPPSPKTISSPGERKRGAQVLKVDEARMTRSSRNSPPRPRSPRNVDSQRNGGGRERDDDTISILRSPRSPDRDLEDQRKRQERMVRHGRMRRRVSFSEVPQATWFDIASVMCFRLSLSPYFVKTVYALR